MNNAPQWLNKAFLLALHSQLIGSFGGSSGIRDQGRLDTAVQRPQQVFHYGHVDLFDLAASYATTLIQGHPFIDGNKRTGFVAAIVFLELNGKQCHSTEVDATLTTLALASGQINEADYAEWLRTACA